VSEAKDVFNGVLDRDAVAVPTRRGLDDVVQHALEVGHRLLVGGWALLGDEGGDGVEHVRGDRDRARTPRRVVERDPRRVRPPAAFFATQGLPSRTADRRKNEAAGEVRARAISASASARRDRICGALSREDARLPSVAAESSAGGARAPLELKDICTRRGLRDFFGSDLPAQLFCAPSRARGREPGRQRSRPQKKKAKAFGRRRCATQSPSLSPSPSPFLSRCFPFGPDSLEAEDAGLHPCDADPD